jgi:hypothetical protein
MASNGKDFDLLPAAKLYDAWGGCKRNKLTLHPVYCGIFTLGQFKYCYNHRSYIKLNNGGTGVDGRWVNDRYWVKKKYKSIGGVSFVLGRHSGAGKHWK